MSNTSDEDRFQYWLMDMDDALDRFLGAMPPDVARKLDSSRDSLLALEQHVLQRYAHIDETRSSSEAEFLDGAARYVGEVFRKELSAVWRIDFKDKKNVFYGLPQISGFVGQATQFCPLTMVTASVDRRTGDYIYSILERCIQRQAEHSDPPE